MSASDKKDRVFMAMAYQLAQLGTCDRKKVGAIVTRRGRCITWGFNGAPPGMPHCSENHHGYDDIYPNGLGAAEAAGCRNATHAEANALAAAARQGISTEGGTLYVTVSPCDTCARLLIAAGIHRVVWCETYRDDLGIRILERAEMATGVILPGE